MHPSDGNRRDFGHASKLGGFPVRLIIGFVLIIAAGGDGLVQDGPRHGYLRGHGPDKEKVRAERL